MGAESMGGEGTFPTYSGDAGDSTVGPSSTESVSGETGHWGRCAGKYFETEAGVLHSGSGACAPCTDRPPAYNSGLTASLRDVILCDVIDS